jgi:hypothetical protein
LVCVVLPVTRIGAETRRVDWPPPHRLSHELIPRAISKQKSVLPQPCFSGVGSGGCPFQSNPNKKIHIPPPDPRTVPPRSPLAPPTPPLMLCDPCWVCALCRHGDRPAAWTTTGRSGLRSPLALQFGGRNLYQTGSDLVANQRTKHRHSPGWFINQATATLPSKV